MIKIKGHLSHDSSDFHDFFLIVSYLILLYLLQVHKRMATSLNVPLHNNNNNKTSIIIYNKECNVHQLLILVYVIL
jgi:hypothetical protein